MPPLVSEEMDDASSLDQESVALATNTEAGTKEAAAEPSVGNETAGAEDRRMTTNDDEEMKDQELDGSHAQNSDDNDLGEQLQRSAEEDESEDGEAESANARLPGVKKDNSTKDADADSDADAEADEDEDEDADADSDAEAEADADADAEADEEADQQEGSGDEEEEGEDAPDDDESQKSERLGEESVQSPSEPEEEVAGETPAEEAKLECMFCKQVEAAEAAEVESPLSCSDCDGHAHLRCARENDAVKHEDYSDWQCPDCVKRHPLSESPKEQTVRSKNSAPRLVRDLLPVTRGVQKPGSHSIFAQPLIQEGEEGGRSLRKRKSLTAEPPPTEKRRRKATPRALEAMTADSKAEAEKAIAHSTRRSSLKITKPTARILQYRPFQKAPPHKFILAFRLDQSKIEEILSQPPRPGKRRGAREKKKVPKIAPPIFQPPVPKFPALPTHNLIFPSAFTDRDSEQNAKPYGGILSEAEADTSRSLPQLKDREIFEIARKEAEEERRKTSAAAEAEINLDKEGTAKPNRTVSGPPTKIKCIQFGKFVIDTFYAAPYPEEYSHESRLFICEYCLKYLPSEFVAYRHKLKCPAKHPPGDEIYRDGTVSVWEVDGRKKTEYCQCLCLMAKMFLGSKTLYYDVEPFLFYILTEYDEFGYHFVGYFSKEKRPASQNNVSCILVMPIHQRKGYAMFLIDFSYLLTRIEGKEGSPEKPLSDMGLTAYRSYWDLTVSRHLLAIGMKPFSTKALMARTGMTADDVIHSLERLYAFVRDPVTKTYAVRYDKKLYERIVQEFESKKHRQLKPESLVWTPYIMGRSDQAALDGQPLHTMAPRDDEDEDEEERDNPVSKALSEAGNAVPDAAVEATEPGHVSPKSKMKSTKSTIDISQPPSSAAAAEGKSVDVKDSSLVNEHGTVAPGPPSTDALNGTVSTQVTQPEVKVNGLDLVNDDDKSNDDTIIVSNSKNANADIKGKGKAVEYGGGGDGEGQMKGKEKAVDKVDEAQPQKPEPEPEPIPEPEPVLTGYALAYRTLNIPPSRFQIDPPIPPAMLRQRSTKKRSLATAFGRPKPGAGGAGGLTDTPSATVAVRSSPRNAATATATGAGAGENNGGGSVTTRSRGATLTFDKVDKDKVKGRDKDSFKFSVPNTPVRRSGRRSGLANTNTVESIELTIENTIEVASPKLASPLSGRHIQSIASALGTGSGSGSGAGAGAGPSAGMGVGVGPSSSVGVGVGPSAGVGAGVGPSAGVGVGAAAADDHDTDADAAADEDADADADADVDAAADEDEDEPVHQVLPQDQTRSQSKDKGKGKVKASSSSSSAGDEEEEVEEEEASAEEESGDNDDDDEDAEIPEDEESDDTTEDDEVLPDADDDDPDDDPDAEVDDDEDDDDDEDEDEDD
ncbi:Histone acetyltransferase [Exophiala xenobiotica]|nr:Histone acetyltransferase [Exophiala xenobiotica]